MTLHARWWMLLALWLLAGIAQAGTRHYYYTDPQGTPLAKADANGTIIATYDYAPYGVAVASMSGAPNGPGYTGHVNDPDTGLVYMQARYYDPAVGRFLSVDPVAPSNAFNFNRYAYGGNNPIGNIDPDGRQTAKYHDDDSQEQRQRAMEERSRRQVEEARMGSQGSYRNHAATPISRIDPKKWQFAVELSSGGSTSVDSKRGIIVQAGGVAGPFRTNQFGYYVTQRQLNADGTYTPFTAPINWGEPKWHSSGLLGSGSGAPTLFSAQPNADGNRWFIEFPYQESAHGNAAHEYLDVFVPRTQ